MDKQLGMHANSLEKAVDNFGGDTSRIAGYLSDRKNMICDRVVSAQSHSIELDAAEDVADHMYNVLFGGNHDG